MCQGPVLKDAVSEGHVTARGTCLSDPGPDAAWDGTCHSCMQQWDCACRRPSAACPALAHSSLHMVCPAQARRQVAVIPKMGKLLLIWEQNQAQGLKASAYMQQPVMVIPFQGRAAGAHPAHVPLEHSCPNMVTWPHGMLSIPCATTGLHQHGRDMGIS